MNLRHRAYFGSAAWPFVLTISNLVTYVDIRARAVAAGWDQVTPLAAEVIVTGTGTLAAGSSIYAYYAGSNFPQGTTLKLSVQPGGRVLGAGGIGGMGSGAGIANAGGAGGTAIYTRWPLAIDNLGTTTGGGGGGGGGGGTYSSNSRAGGGGGGGGAGSNAGLGNAGGTPTDGYTNFPGYASSNGTETTGGAGGGRLVIGDGAIGFEGGVGGALGQAGGAGASGGNVSGASGGLAGAYIDGASYATWINTGTRLGRSIN